MDSYDNLNATLPNDTTIFACFEGVTDAVNGPKKMDKIILMFLYGITACFITVLNAYMFNILRKKDRKRANMQFMILTFSDMMNGMISLPIVMLKFVNFGESLNCKIRVLVQFAYLFPVTYSWLITVGIFFDRLIMISIPIFREVLMNRINLLYRILSLILCFLISIKSTHSAWKESEVQYTFTEASNKKSNASSAFQLYGEICVIILVCVLQLVLAVKVNRKEREIEQNRGANSYNRRVTNTIILLMLFTVLSTIPRIIIFSLEIHKNALADNRMRSGYYWVNIGVLGVHFNSLFSAVILIQRTSTFKVAKINKNNTVMMTLNDDWLEDGKKGIYFRLTMARDYFKRQWYWSYELLSTRMERKWTCYQNYTRKWCLVLHNKILNSKIDMVNATVLILASEGRMKNATRLSLQRPHCSLNGSFLSKTSVNCVAFFVNLLILWI